MARTLSNRHGFQGKFRFREEPWPDEVEIDVEIQKFGSKKTFWQRLPWIVKLIVFLFAAAIGVIVGIIVWLIQIAFSG